MRPLNRVDMASGDKLLIRLDDTLGAMSGMLNTLLDINGVRPGCNGLPLSALAPR